MQALGIPVPEKPTVKKPRQPAVYAVPQVGREAAILPPENTKFDSSEEAEEYKAVELPSAPVFEKDQLIAKACKLNDDSYEFFVGRVCSLTKEGPWVRFPDCPWKLTDISIENYGKLWMFVVPRNPVTIAKPTNARTLLNKQEKAAKMQARKAKMAAASLPDVAFSGGEPLKPLRT